MKKSGDQAKLRLRGKGSGFAERDTGEESPEPLQLCISCPSQSGYDIARRPSLNERPTVSRGLLF